MALAVGTICYLNYGEGPPAVYHTRLVLGHVTGTEHLIRTPDGDVYVEDLSHANPDLVSFEVGPDDGTIPVGIPPGSVYGFRGMTMQEYHAILADGRVELAAEQARRGIVAPAAMVAGPMSWYLAESIPGRKIGELVQPVPGFPQDGDYGLVRLTDSEGNSRPCLVKQMVPEEVAAFCEERVGLARASESAEGSDRSASEDVRTMEVRYAISGERQRSFRESVAEMTQVDFDDFPLNPRTSLPYLKAISSLAESAFAQHLSWVSQSKIPEGDRAIHEDEVLARAIDLAITYDALQVSNLASMELLIRRRQLIAQAHQYNPSAPSYDGADHFMGTSYRPGSGVIVQELTEYVSRQMHQESLILKERRKQAEMKGTGKGKGPGKPTPPPNPKAPAPGAGGAGK